MLAIEMDNSYYFFDEDAERVHGVLGVELHNREPLKMCIYPKNRIRSDETVERIKKNGLVICLCDRMEGIDPIRKGGCISRKINGVIS